MSTENVSAQLKAIATMVRRARAHRSQAEFAELVGISRSALSSYENGTRKADDYTLTRISMASQYSAEDLKRGYAQSDLQGTELSFGVIRSTDLDGIFALVASLVSIEGKREILEKALEVVAFDEIKRIDKTILTTAINASIERIDEILEERKRVAKSLSSDSGGPQ